MSKLVLEKPPSVCARLCKSRSKLYDEIAKGLCTPFIRLSPKSVALPSHEVDALIAARVAGKTDDEIRTLVKTLVAQRSSVATNAA